MNIVFNNITNDQNGDVINVTDFDKFKEMFRIHKGNISSLTLRHFIDNDTTGKDVIYYILNECCSDAKGSHFPSKIIIDEKDFNLKTRMVNITKIFAPTFVEVV